MQPLIDATGGKAQTMMILSVSPSPEDHVTLQRLLAELAPDDLTPYTWHVSATSTLSLAMKALQGVPYPVLLCERDLPDGDWRDLLKHTSHLSDPPLVIVTSRLADDVLWAEALNVGAHDVLAKPFETSEVIRVVSLACMRWFRDRPYPVRKTSLRRAVSRVPSDAVWPMTAVRS